MKPVVLLSAIAIALSGCSASFETGPILVGGTSYANSQGAVVPIISEAYPVAEIRSEPSFSSDARPVRVSALGLRTYRTDTYFTVALLLGKPAGTILQKCAARGGFRRSEIKNLVNAKVNLRKVTLTQAPSKAASSNEGSFFFLDVRNQGNMSPVAFAGLNQCVEKEAFKDPRIKWTNENLVL